MILLLLWGQSASLMDIRSVKIKIAILSRMRPFLCCDHRHEISLYQTSSLESLKRRITLFTSHDWTMVTPESFQDTLCLVDANFCLNLWTNLKAFKVRRETDKYPLYRYINLFKDTVASILSFGLKTCMTHHNAKASWDENINKE